MKFKIIKSFTQDITNNFLAKQLLIQNKMRHEHDELLKKKFECIHKQQLPSSIINGEKKFVNLSSVIIPEKVQHFLGLGPKFSVEKHELPLINIIANSEQII